MTPANLHLVATSSVSASTSPRPRAAGSADQPASFASALGGTLQVLAAAAHAASSEAAGADAPMQGPDVRTSQEPQADTLALLLASTQLQASRTTDAPDDSATPADETLAVRLGPAEDSDDPDRSDAGSLQAQADTPAQLLAGTQPPAVGTDAGNESAAPDDKTVTGRRGATRHDMHSAFQSGPVGTLKDSPALERDPAGLSLPETETQSAAGPTVKQSPGAGSRGDAAGQAVDSQALPPRASLDTRDSGQASVALSSATPARTVQAPAAATASAAGNAGNRSFANALAGKLDATGKEGSASTSMAMTVHGSDAEGAPPEAPLAAPNIEVPSPFSAAGVSVAAPQPAAGTTPSSPVVASGLVSTVGSAEWATELTGQVLQFGPGREIELNLNPAELGPLRVRLSVADNQAQILFTSEHQAVRHALEAALPQLRAAFADNGISLGQTTVGSDAGKPMFQGEAGQGERQREGRPEQPRELQQAAASDTAEARPDSQRAVDTFV